MSKLIMHERLNRRL